MPDTASPSRQTASSPVAAPPGPRPKYSPAQRVCELASSVNRSWTVISNDPFTVPAQDCVSDRVSARNVVPPSSEIFCRSEEHTSELQSRENLVCRLLLGNKNT